MGTRFGFLSSGVLAAALFFLPPPATADIQSSSEKNWREFSAKLEGWREEERVDGVSYLVSGTLVTLGGVAGFYSTRDPFGQIVFSVAQGLGIGAIGHGLYKLQLGHELNDMYEVLENTKSLNAQQRTEIFYDYQRRWRARRDKEERIQALVYALGGAVYLYNATQVEKGPPRNVLYGLSALSFALSIKLAF